MSKSFVSFQILAIAAVCASLSACAFSKNEGPSPEEQKISALNQQLDANRPLVREDFKHNFIANNNVLNDYRVRISWPSAKPLQIKIIQKGEVLHTADGRYENSYELKCSKGRITYNVEVLSAGGGTLSQPSFDLECPYDLAVDQGSANMEVLKGVTGRLELKTGSEILVTDSPLEINVEELRVVGFATVRVLAHDRKANSTDWYNHPAPVVRINAKKASGNLKLELNGVDGYSVHDGDIIPDRSLDGAPGAPAQLEEVCTEGRTSRLGDTLPGKCKMVCKVPPTDGGKGRLPYIQVDGKTVLKKGEKGADGYAGISTSKADIQIEDVTSFNLEIGFNPGIASAPGRGTLPKGGAGGPPGANPQNICPPAHQGLAAGGDGVRGDNGDPAPHGRCETVYVSSSLLPKVKKVNVNEARPCAAIEGIVQVGRLPRE